MEPPKTVNFGLHLMVDAYGCDAAILADANVLYRFLDEMPGRLNMKKMIKPYVVTTPGNGVHDPGGWSGFVIIEDSHISLHTFVKRKFVTIDVYTCKDFDTEEAQRYIQDFFKAQDLEVYVQPRGTKYPNQNVE